LISADVPKQNSSIPEDWATRVADADDAPRAVQEYLHTLDDEALGAVTATKPKFAAHADPASQWSKKGQKTIWKIVFPTNARKGPAFFAYSTNYLIDTDHSIIVDVDASRSNRTAEVEAMRKMIDRIEERFGLKPHWIAAVTPMGRLTILFGSHSNARFCRSSQCLTKVNARTARSPDLTSHGMMRTTAISVLAAK
jgi:hypothetical protein